MLVQGYKLGRNVIGEKCRTHREKFRTGRNLAAIDVDRCPFQYEFSFHPQGPKHKTSKMVYDQNILPKIAHLKADSADLLPSLEVFSLKKRGLICKESLSKVTSQVYKGWLLFTFHYHSQSNCLSRHKRLRHRNNG